MNFISSNNTQIKRGTELHNFYPDDGSDPDVIFYNQFDYKFLINCR